MRHCGNAVRASSVKRENDMNILVLNGSPKRENSDTLAATRAFLEGMNDVSENSVKLIHVIDMKIGYCIGCFTCMKNGGNCVLDDDMAEITEDILSSDLLVFSFPLYCCSMPASLKALVERLLPLSSLKMTKRNGIYEHIPQRDFSRLRYLMVSGCGFPDGRNSFEPAVMLFERIFPCNHTVITVPESPLFNVKEASSLTERKLGELRRGGREYAETGRISEELLRKIGRPMMDEERYVSIVNGSV
jgi:multimeric flavodoxin WrbA